jgi:uncharacterized phage protein (TIGR02218 family)
MKVIPAPLLAAIQAETSTTCWCAILTRLDGVQFGFTEHDWPLVVSGVTCNPAIGANLTSLASTAEMSVDNADMLAFLDSDEITENDLMRGVYDAADLRIVLVDWNDLAAGELVLARGVLGEISMAGDAFTAEFRSLTQYLQQTIGRKCGIECDVAALGDDRCGVDLAAYTHVATVLSVPDPLREFTVDVPGAPGGDVNYFSYGMVEWTNGDGRNTQRDNRIVGWDDASKLVTVAGTTVNEVEIGDTLLIPARLALIILSITKDIRMFPGGIRPRRPRMVSRSDIVSEARSWIGTPYLHLQRDRGRFSDCAGLIIGVARSLGLGDYRKLDYSAIPDPVHMEKVLKDNLDPVSVSNYCLGDILWLGFRYPGKDGLIPVHLGIVGDYPGGGYSLIHAYSISRCVTEHRLDVKWKRRIHAAFRYRNLLLPSTCE